MKVFFSSLKLSFIALMTGMSSLHAQWNTIEHDATTNRGISDLFFISSTGYAAGWRADNVTWGTRALLYKTTDGGQNWNMISIPLLIGSDSVMGFKSIHFINPNTGFAAASCYTTNGSVGLYYGALFETTDGGQTWTSNFSAKSTVNYATTFTTNFNHIFFSGAYTGVISAQKQTAANTYDGISYNTFNGGNSWNPQTTAFNTPANAAFFSNNGNGALAGGKIIGLSGPYNGKIAHSTDAGNSWTTAFTDAGFGYVDVQFPLAQIGYAVGDSMYGTLPGQAKGKMVMTNDGGASWSAISYFNNFRPLCVYFSDAYNGYVGGETGSGNSGLLHTSDGGITWTPENYPDITNGYGSFISSIVFSTPVTGYASNSYTSSNSVYGNFLQSCGVYAGNDTTFCQLHGQLFATPATPGNYTFSWSPASGLDNPNIQNPTVISGVQNQQYVVTMSDASSSCVTTDTINISAYYFHFDTAYSCNAQPVTFDIGPGATQYTVQYTDTLGNGHFVILPNEFLVATQPVQYLVIANYPGCGTLTSLYTVIDSCNVPVNNVWPGDCNYDLSVNMADALHIGLAYGATGPVRPAASNAWYAQPMADWPQNFVNCNYKHADADGNGLVDVNDTLPIAQNYGFTHPYRFAAPQNSSSVPSLTLVANYDTVGLQTLVNIDVRLGTSAFPIDSLYGISFRLSTDAGLIDTTLTTVNLSSTWLGTNGNNLFGFRKHFRSNGVVDCAESRNDHLNYLNGNGSIGSLSIVTTDNLSGIAICHFKVTDITAVTVSQHYLSLNSVNDSVVIDPSHPAGIATETINSSFTLYPNPANEVVTVQSGFTASQIEICDLLGRTIETLTPTGPTTNISTAALAEGVYLLRVRNGNAQGTQKLFITR